jgi:hypothetical protein
MIDPNTGLDTDNPTMPGMLPAQPATPAAPALTPAQLAGKQQLAQQLAKLGGGQPTTAATPGQPAGTPFSPGTMPQGQMVMGRYVPPSIGAQGLTALQQFAPALQALMKRQFGPQTQPPGQPGIPVAPPTTDSITPLPPSDPSTM